MVVLVAVVLVNYAAQIPYYFILYFPRPPSMLGVVLLAATLVWFLVGFVRYRQARRFGGVLLGGFLATEVAFYSALVLLSAFTGGRGGAAAQLTARDPRLWTIFAIGYLNLVVAAVALARLLSPRSRLARELPPG